VKAANPGTSSNTPATASYRRIGSNPSKIVSGGSKGFNRIAWDILVREQAHR
jgi:hypothetical protein